jgi:hypothetical protein
MPLRKPISKKICAAIHALRRPSSTGETFEGSGNNRHATDSTEHFQPNGGFDRGFDSRSRLPPCRCSAPLEQNLAEYRFAAAYFITSERRFAGPFIDA